MLALSTSFCYNLPHNKSNFLRSKTISNPTSRTRINGEIRHPEVRVISADGAQLGIMSSRDAQLMARDAGLDLVEISPNANPPVVKIIDWGKYQYQKMKEQARAKKNAKSSELKQIRLGLKIGENDLNIKVRKTLELLEDGDRVKIMIVFRGREMAHKEIGTDLMNRIIEKLGSEVIVDGKAQMSGRNLTFMVRHK